jgi:hypothetical protein
VTIAPYRGPQDLTKFYEGVADPKDRWASIGKLVGGSINHPYPQEYLGIEVQRVHEEDYIERRRRYLMEWTALKGERSRQWDKWRELADFVMPEQGRFLTSQHNQPKNVDRILNNTPTRYARSLAAGLLAMHTSPARWWLNLTVADPDLAEYGPMKRALWELNRRVRLIYEISGLYKLLGQCVYPGLVTFGLGTGICEEDKERVLRFIPLSIGTYALAKDGRNHVDTLFYEEAWTVSELVKEFGWANVSNSIRVAYNGGWYEQYVAVLRVITPNERFIPGSVGKRGARWGSSWMEIGGLNSAAGALAQPSTDPVVGFLRDSHYPENPILCARWLTTSTDVYPTGPGHDALPDCRMLMQLERRELLAISKGVNPAMLMPDVLQTSSNTALPGDAIYYPTGTQGVEIKPAFVPEAAMLDKSMQKSAAAMERIGQAFFGRMMLLFTEQSPAEGKQPETAQEIVAKQQEQMLQLGPMLENINDFLTNLVERTIAIMARQRLLPKFPDEARGHRLKVEFTSTMAQAQKLIQVQQKERFIQFLGQVMALDPKAMLKLNAPKMVDRYADDIGLEPDVTHDDQQYQALVQEQARQAQQAQQSQDLLTASEAAKSLGKVPMDEDNMMTRLAGKPAAAQTEGA